MLLAPLRPDNGDSERRPNVRARKVVPHCMEHVTHCDHVWLEFLRDGDEIRTLKQLISAP